MRKVLDAKDGVVVEVGTLPLSHHNAQSEALLNSTYSSCAK